MDESWQVAVERVARRLAGTAASGAVPDAVDAVDATEAVDPVEGWCAEHAGPDAIVVTTVEDLRRVGPGAVMSLPGTLERVDPAALLEGAVTRLTPEGAVVAAVGWRTSPTADVARAFHPASFVGAFAPWFLVERLEVADHVLGLRARSGGSVEERDAAAMRALLAAQPAVEAALDEALGVSDHLRAWEAAAAGLQGAVVESGRTYRATRRERNDFRKGLRAARDEAAGLRGVVAGLEAQLEEERRRSSELADRLQQLQSARWWRVGVLLAKVRRRPWRALVRAMRSLRSGRRR